MTRNSRGARVARGVSVGLIGVLSLTGCPQGEPVEPIHEEEVPAGALTDAERAIFYHKTQGADLFPYGLFLALEDPDNPGTLLKDNLARFGFVDDPLDEHCLPVGLTVSRAPDLDMDMVGFNCAVCHVGAISYQGETRVFDGIPNMTGDLFGFRDALVGASEHMMEHPIKLWKTWKKVRKLQGSACEAPADGPALTGEEEQQVVAADAEFDDDFDDHTERDAKLSFLDDVLDEAEDLRQEELRFEHVMARLAMTVSYFSWAYEVETTPAGPGRADAWGASRNMMFTPQSMDAPVTIPNLWQFEDIEWLHWIGNTNAVMRRNMAEAMAFGSIWDRKSNWTSAVLENLDEFEKIAYKIEPPEWPEDMLGSIDRTLAAEGAKLFQASCAGCHEGGKIQNGLTALPVVPFEKLGTDPAEVENYNRPLLDDGWKGETNFSKALATALTEIEEQYWVDHAVPVEQQKSWNNDRGEVIWLADIKGYPARRLRGVWATPPFLHNGSVPTLDDLLKPSDCTQNSECRPAKFALGTREYDPQRLGIAQIPVDTEGVFVLDTSLRGNSNAGHEGPGYGTDWSAEQRAAVLEFLKTY